MVERGRAGMCHWLQEVQPLSIAQSACQTPTAMASSHCLSSPQCLRVPGLSPNMPLKLEHCLQSRQAGGKEYTVRPFQVEFMKMAGEWWVTGAGRAGRGAGTQLIELQGRSRVSWSKTQTGGQDPSSCQQGPSPRRREENQK